MLLLISPAKTLDFDTPAHVADYTSPKYAARSAELIELLRRKSAREIGELMDLSDTLSTLNVDRYAAWRRRNTASNSKQAVLAFDGDVYEGLDARSLDAADLQWAQEHLAILSGLYGLLRPLDRIQPYRLEMGTRLRNERGASLYDYWGATIARDVNARLKGAANPVVVNLASDEYFSAVDRKALHSRVVECVFQDWKTDRYKVISFFAKRARGLMARYAITHRVGTPSALRAFNAEGYAFDPLDSTEERMVFRRRIE